MKKFIIAVSMFVMSVLIGPGTILASDITDAIYRADIRATNSSYTAMKVSAPFTWSTQSLLDGYYINSGFTNLALRDSNGQDIAFMPGWDTNPWMFYINQISQNSVLNYSLYTGGETAMGGKLAYFPDTAGMTIADAASLELGNSFEIELSGYFNTSEAIGSYLMLKQESIALFISDNEEISILGPAALDANGAGGSSGEHTYGTHWSAQTFLPSNSGYLTSISLQGVKVGTPPGNAIVSVYLTASGKPTGSPLVSATFDPTTWSTIYGTFNTPVIFENPLYVSSGTVYAIVLSVPSASSGSNDLFLGRGSSNNYADGTIVLSTNSGGTWTINTSYDFGFKTYITPTGSVASVEQGEHIIKVTLSGGAMSLYIDGVLADSVAFAGSVPDNANNWVIGANGSMPYLYYAKITVGGVLRGSWAWEYSDTFTDLSGNGNDATPSFKTISTDADVSAAIISYNAYNLSALVVSGDDEGIQIIDDDEISDTPAGFFGALDPDRLEFLSPINEIISEAGIPLEFVWYPFIFGGGAAITMISFGVTRKLLPCIIAGGIWTGFLSAALGADLWTVLPFVVVAATELVNRKTVSL